MLPSLVFNTKKKSVACPLCFHSFGSVGLLKRHHLTVYRGKPWVTGPQRSLKKVHSKPIPKLHRMTRCPRSNPRKHMWSSRIKINNIMVNDTRTKTGSKEELSHQLGIPSGKLRRWSNHLQNCLKSRKANRGQYCMSPNDHRAIGKFWKQQGKMYTMYKFRRDKGDPIDND